VILEQFEHHHLYESSFTARRNATAVYVIIACLLVRLSVCLSQVGVL